MEKRSDVYETITNAIVEAIEAGQARGDDWEMPWHRTTANGSPRNAITGNYYRGSNVLSLWIAGRGYGSNLFASYKQWGGRGCQVRKGSKGLPVVYASKFTVERENATTGETETKNIPFLKLSYVFAAEQVEGGEAFITEIKRPSEVEAVAAADGFFSAIPVKVEHGLNRAFYSSAEDFVHMPARDTFKATRTSSATANYYSTLAHEFGHATGHKSRLERKLGNRFGSAEYAAEELIAELSASFTMAHLGLESSPRVDHAQYIASWLEVLKGDKRAIFTASAAAQAATDWLIKAAAPVAVAA